MKRIVSLMIVSLAISIGDGWTPTLAVPQETKASVATKGKNCRMEQQCRWENFKKICTYVKVCR
jgi:hypothetical protein